MNLSEINCKYCGCYSAAVHPGKGPHAHEIKCGECGKHIKWASAIDIESANMSEEEINSAIRQNEWAAIIAAKNNNFQEFASSIKKRDRYLEKVS